MKATTGLVIWRLDKSAAIFRHYRHFHRSSHNRFGLTVVLE